MKGLRGLVMVAYVFPATHIYHNNYRLVYYGWEYFKYPFIGIALLILMLEF